MTQAPLFSKLLTGAFIGVILIATIIDAQANEPCAISITAPEKNAEVERQTIVKGTAEIPRGNYLWVLVRRSDFRPLWWPQREAQIDPKTFQWRAAAVLGGPQDVGWDFDIGVIAVDENGHAFLRNYWINAMKSGDWKPIEIPQTSCPPTILKVKKVHH